MVFEWAVTGDGGGLTGNNLRRHRAEHLLLGKGACRRLAKLLPGHAVDNGTAAEVPFALAEWLSSVVLRLDPGAEAKLIYANQLGPNRMGKALDRALGKIKSDEPRHASVLRAERRRFGAIDFDKGGSGTEAYILHANELYEVATAFPTGADIDDVYDWIGATSVAHRESTYPTGAKGKLMAMLTAMAATSEAFHVAPPAGAGRARGCGVPALAADAFDKVGGMIFVPVRYATPHVPEFGLPCDAAGCWFGEAGITVERGVREAALATACNWSDQLWGVDCELVPFGLFEDVGGAGGQVTGVIAPPPDVRLRALDPLGGDGLAARSTIAQDARTDTRTAASTIAQDACTAARTAASTIAQDAPRSTRTCVDLFAGAGGLALGLSGAGFDHLALVEHDARKVATLQRNGFAQVLCADVGAVDYAPWAGAVDLLAGGPPWQPFSSGGLRRGAADARNGSEATLDATLALRPRAVLFENVQGMLTARFEAYRDAISARLSQLGYHHGWLPLNAADHGVPQHRRRVFLVGFADLAAWEAFVVPPTVSPRPTVRGVLRELGPPNGRDGHEVHGRAREYEGHTASALDAPSKTIVGGGRGLGGGSGTVRLDSGAVRYFTVREAATLQTFPADWRFDEVWSRAFVEIGNAVPPLLARALGEAVARALDVAGVVHQRPNQLPTPGSRDQPDPRSERPPITGRGEEVSGRRSAQAAPRRSRAPAQQEASNQAPATRSAAAAKSSGSSTDEQRAATLEELAARAAPALGAATRVAEGEPARTVGCGDFVGCTLASVPALVAPRAAGLASPTLHRAAQPAADSGDLVKWVRGTALMGTPLERVARLAAARVESFARPAPLLRQPEAKTGAMDATYVLAAAAPSAPTAACTAMTADEVWGRATRAVSALRAALEAKVAELEASGVAEEAWLASELVGWLSVLEPPRLGDIDAAVLAQACAPTNPELALPRGCGVPALAADAFDKVGGMIFVPVRYATPHVPEFGLPCDAAGCWFGEAGITVERGVREAALATACNWSDQLWGVDCELVPFGLFEDVGGAGGQVTGVIAPPPDVAQEVPRSTRTCVDLFAGAGGLALGLSGAGFDHLALVEHDARKVATLQRNGFAQVLCADVGAVDYAPWAGAVDLLAGGPPWQPFSSGGLRRGAADARNGSEATLDATLALRPRAVLFENVQGMLTARFEAYRDAISARLSQLGYHHGWLPLNAADHGVPQHRRRVFLVGFADLAAWEAFVVPPTVSPRPTVRGVLRELGPPNGRDGHEVHGRAREYEGHTASALDAPSKTIVGGGRGLGGGSGTVRLDSGAVRYFTVREAATLQTFPADWRFDEVWSRAFVEIGNAVPPLLARALGEAVARALDVAGVVHQRPNQLPTPGSRDQPDPRSERPPITGRGEEVSGRRSAQAAPRRSRAPAQQEASNQAPATRSAAAAKSSGSSTDEQRAATLEELAARAAPALGAATRVAEGEPARTVGCGDFVGCTLASVPALVAPRAAGLASPTLHRAAQPAADSGDLVKWVRGTALMGTPLERVARLAAARVESFARPAPLLRQPEAKTGAMDATYVLAAAAPSAPTAACTAMTADEVWGRATRAVSALRAALEAKVAELEASGVAEEAWLASELVGWLSVLEPPRLGDIDAAVLAQACAPTDPELALLSFPAWARPVTTPPMPPLPQPPPPAAVPGHVRSWRDAFSKEAYDAMLKWFRDVRRAINQFMRGVEGEALWRLVPRSMAFGIEHFQPWLAQLAAAGHVVARVKEGFEVVDTSRAPPTKLNRPYLAELFAETGCADLLLRDAVLTHGFVYFADMAPQVVLQKPLRSFFTGVEQLLSLHSETLRMSESGWFELICMPELDAGVIELPCCPCRLDPSGLVGRQLEARVRGIKNCGAPHELLLCMAPPSPPLHEHSGGGRVPVISTNAATGMRSGKGVVREARAQAAGGKLPPAAQRHTPGLRRAAEAFGERDTLEIGRAPAPSSASGAARGETKSWAGGRWLWPQELKPFFIDLMLAACILGHGAELCGADLYVAGDDIKDMFHAFPLAALQCWSMGLLRLDPHALTAESLDAALCVVQARCLEMGVAPSSNWAQRFLTEINLGFSKRFARANEPLLLALDEAHPHDTIVTTPKGDKALRRWLAQLRSTAGTTALSAAFALRRAGVGGTVHALRSDAAILGTGKPAICGALYGAVYVLALTPQWLEMPIVVLEYLGGLLNLIIFGPRLRGAPCALLLDALVVPTVMAGKASAPMMRFLQLRFVALVRDLELNLQVGHEYGPFNPICDAGSRGKMREMEAIINNLNLTLEHVDVPAAGLELMAETHAEWSRLAETERAAARAADAEVAALRRQHGVRAVMAHPGAGGCAPEALGLGRSPACNAYDGPGSEAEHFAPAGLESGLAAAADAPRVRVGRTANGPTAAAPVGVAVEVVALPLTRSAASDTSDGYAHWPPAEATTIGVKKEPAGCTTIGVKKEPAGFTTIGVDVNVCGPRVQRATNGGKGGPGVCPRRCVPRACLVVFAALASAIEGAVFGAPSAAHAMGAPLLVAAAAGVRVTGLDLLQQRALGAQAGSVRDGAALPTPTSSGLPAGYQVVVDAQAPAAPGPRYATGLDFLRARTGAAAPLGSRAPDPIGSSWAARGGSPFFLGTDPTSAAAAWRRAAGLSVMPEGGARREAMTERLSEALEHGYAPRTRAADQGHWRRWERFVPERKLSFTDAIVADMFRCPDGATRGALTLDWSSYYWIAVDACFQTLAEEGSRKDEVSKPTAATPFRRGRFTFASLVWFVDGRELRRAPTREELLTLKPGDGVLLKHGISKNDPFGSYFAATPSFLAYREGTDRCACRALARLELAAGLAGAARGRTPLFGPEPGVEFTHHQLDQALKLLLTRGAGVAEAELENYSVHSFRIFVACALLAAGAPRWLIKRMLCWRGDESLEVYARVNNTEWASWTGKIVNVAVQSTISSRLNYMDFSEETTAHFNAVAQSMLTLGVGRQRNAPETF